MKDTSQSRLDNALLRLTLTLVALVFVGSVGTEMVGAAFPAEAGSAAPSWQQASSHVLVGQR